MKPRISEHYCQSNGRGRMVRHYVAHLGQVSSTPKRNRAEAIAECEALAEHVLEQVIHTPMVIHLGEGDCMVASLGWDGTWGYTFHRGKVGEVARWGGGMVDGSRTPSDLRPKMLEHARQYLECR